jgi:hypothetical protein
MLGGALAQLQACSDTFGPNTGRLVKALDDGVVTLEGQGCSRPDGHAPPAGFDELRHEEELDADLRRRLLVRAGAASSRLSTTATNSS